MTADEPTVVDMAGHQSSTVDDLTRAIAKSIGDHEFEEAHGLVHSVTGKWRSPGSSAALNGLLRFRVRIEMTRTAVVRERFGLDGDSDRYADASLLLLSLLSGRLVAATTTDGSQRSDGVRTHALRAAALRVADELIRRGACRGDDRALGLAVRLELPTRRWSTRSPRSCSSATTASSARRAGARQAAATGGPTGAPGTATTSTDL
jgi:hypothetical protein